MRKIVRLSESELTRLVKRIIREQSADGPMQPRVNTKLSANVPKQPTVSTKRSFSDIQSWDDRLSLSDEEHDLLVKRQQIKDIIDNFENINCDDHMLGDWDEPEHLQIYCDYYRGKSKNDMIRIYNSL